MRRQDGLTFIYINIFQTALCQKGELRLPKKIFKKRKKKRKKISTTAKPHTQTHTTWVGRRGGWGLCLSPPVQNWQSCHCQHCGRCQHHDRFNDEDSNVFLLAELGKFCHWFGKSIALEQNAAITYFSCTTQETWSLWLICSLMTESKWFRDADCWKWKSIHFVCAYWLANCVLLIITWQHANSSLLQTSVWLACCAANPEKQQQKTTATTKNRKTTINI